MMRREMVMVRDGLNHVVNLVDNMLALNKKLAGLKTPNSRNITQRRIDELDKQINKQVYAVYELTDDEIRVVEQEQE